MPLPPIPNSRERQLAAKFYLNSIPGYVQDWIAGDDTTHLDVDEDIVALAQLLAKFRDELIGAIVCEGCGDEPHPNVPCEYLK